MLIGDRKEKNRFIKLKGQGGTRHGQWVTTARTAAVQVTRASRKGAGLVSNKSEKLSQ